MYLRQISGLKAHYSTKYILFCQRAREKTSDRDKITRLYYLRMRVFLFAEKESTCVDLTD